MSKQKQGFMKRWTVIRAKGFKKFYVRQALGCFSIMMFGNGIFYLTVFRLPTQAEWPVDLAVALIIAVIFPSLIWHWDEKKYRIRLEKYGQKATH